MLAHCYSLRDWYFGISPSDVYHEHNRTLFLTVSAKDLLSLS